MTGIERLRGFARRMDDLGVWPGGAKLLDMADQIEREQAARLMPDGYEWPRYEDGSPVLIGGEVDGIGKVSRICLIKRGFYFNASHVKKLRVHGYGERVRRPQVLAADGEPLEAGQTVYNIGSDIHRVVSHVEYERAGTPIVRYEDGSWDFPDLITHQRPMLDSDGVPIKVGDTAWGSNSGLEYLVKGYSRLLGEPCVVVERNGVENRMFPSQLTQTKPESDSWERVEADAKKDPHEYCEDADLRAVNMGREAEEYAMARDLVLRCKALARVSE